VTTEDMSWQRLVEMLYRCRGLILQVWLTITVVVAIGVWLYPPRYRATATLMVTSVRAPDTVSADAGSRQPVNHVTDEDLNSEVALLQSEELLRQALDPYRAQVEGPNTLGEQIGEILTLPVRLPGMFYRGLHGVPASSPFERWVAKTADDITVDPIRRSNLIEVSHEAREPQWAAELVNRLVALHVERHTLLSQQSNAQRFFDEQRRLLSGRSREAEALLDEFYQREGWDSIPERRALLRAQLAEFEAALARAESDQAAGSSRVAFLTEEIRNHPKMIRTESRLAQNQAVQFMKPRVLELEMERNDLAARYAADSLRVRDVEQELDAAKRLLKDEKETVAETRTSANPTFQTLEIDLAQAQAELSAVRARVEALRSQTKDARATIEHLDEVASEQARLEQEVATTKEAFVVYSKKTEEARVSSALDESNFVNIALAEPATVPTSPAKPRALLMLVLGAIMGLPTAIAVAVVYDRLDPSVKSAVEAADMTGLRVLAELSAC